MLDVKVVQALVAGILGLFPSASAGVASFVSSMIDQLPLLVGAGSDAISFITGQMALVGTMIAANRDPTQAEWDALNATVADELAKLNAQGSP